MSLLLLTLLTEVELLDFVHLRVHDEVAQPVVAVQVARAAPVVNTAQVRALLVRVRRIEDGVTDVERLLKESMRFVGFGLSFYDRTAWCVVFIGNLFLYPSKR